MARQPVDAEAILNATKVKPVPDPSVNGNGNHPSSPEAAMLAGVQLLARTGGVVEARVLNTKRGTASGYFDNYEALALAVLPFYQQQNIYITLNPVHPDLLHRAANRLREWVKRDGDTTKDIEVARRIWFPIDLDPDRPTGIGSTRAELNHALAKQAAVVAHLNAMGFPRPVEVMSGNGAHILYACDLPNDEPTAQLFRRALAAVKAQFEDAEVLVDTTVHSAGQIWKLPGSYSVKGDPSAERPHRVATVLERPAMLELVSVDLLTQLAALAPTGSSAGPSTGRNRGGYVRLEVADAMKARGWYREDLGGGKHGVVCPWQAEHSGDSGVTEAAIFEPEADGLPWGFKCMHQHCADRHIQDLLKVLDLHAPPSDPGTRIPLRADQGDLKVATAEAWAVLAETNEPPVIVTVGDEVMHLAQVQEDEHDPVRLQPLSASWLRAHLAEVAYYHTVEEDDEGTQKIYPKYPPMPLMENLLHTDSRPRLPRLTRVVPVPIFTEDGTLLTEPGYHAGSGCYYAPRAGFTMPAVSDHPSPEEIHAARERLYTLIKTFPFDNPEIGSDRANGMAMPITMMARDLIPGPSPIFLFEKPQARSGASLLAGGLLRLILGRSPETMRWPVKEEEREKTIISTLVEGPACIFFDNVVAMDSASLAAAITAPVYSGRRLATNERIKVPVRCVWVVTGNNPELSRELALRTVTARVDAKMEHPEERTFDLPDEAWLAHIDTHRGALLAAVATLIRAWVVAGRPRGLTPGPGGFSGWSAVVGGILQVAGVPGFLQNLSRGQARATATSSGVRVLIARWWEKHHDVEVTTNLLYREFIYSHLGVPNLDAPDLDIDGPTDHVRKGRLGKLIGSLEGQFFLLPDGVGRVRVVHPLDEKGKPKEDRSGSALWRLQPVREPVA